MNELQTMWSISRRKSLINCPRQYVLRYSNNQNKYIKKKKNITKKSLEDIFVSSLREVMIERLEDQRNGIIWSEKMIFLKIKMNLELDIGTKALSKIRNSNSKFLEDLILSAKKQLDSLWKTNIFRRINTNKIKRWSCLDRKKSVPSAHIDIFCSPDLIFQIQNKWHLLRIDLLGEKVNSFEDLEALAMVNWSLKNRNLPDISKKYIVHVLKFRNGKWIHERFLPTDELLEQSKQLLEKDVNQMNNLLNKLGPMRNLSIIPLSNNHYHCKKCIFKNTCPAKNGLAKAKIEQKLAEYNFAREKFLTN